MLYARDRKRLERMAVARWKLDRRVQGAVIDLTARGARTRELAEPLGVAPATVWKWLQRKTPPEERGR